MSEWEKIEDAVANWANGNRKDAVTALLAMDLGVRCRALEGILYPAGGDHVDIGVRHDAVRVASSLLALGHAEGLKAGGLV